MTDTTHDVLIEAGAQTLAHKWRPTLAPDEEAYWRVSGTPRQTEPGRRVWFAAPRLDVIHAWGKITALDDGRLWFDGARGTHVPCLDDPPTRGFTYIDPLLPRLEDVEWEEQPTGRIEVVDAAGGDAIR